ncbi:Nitronate monooxygenase [Cladorrhinum sp. PSN259]|nr:Nitronate monooxygenase [Cladorrhinum sp. PSN259]
MGCYRDINHSDFGDEEEDEVEVEVVVDQNDKTTLRKRGEKKSNNNGKGNGNGIINSKWFSLYSNNNNNNNNHHGHDQNDTIILREPLIISAPMFGSANGKLAGEVTKAGGIGFIGGGYLFNSDSQQLIDLASQLTTARQVLGVPKDGKNTMMPVGVGFILCHESTVLFVKSILPILKQNRPAAVWLFAPRPEDVESGVVKDIVQALKKENFMVWFQVGTVEGARRAAMDGADVLVAQGADAGGHAFEGGAGVISLVVEVKRMLEDLAEKKQKELGKVQVVAAGGFVEGSGVAAALALGAEGVVMGTRFLLAEEAGTPEWRQGLLIASNDGGPSTYKSPVMDDIQGTAIWPKDIDGRALKTDSVRDHIEGLPLKENIALFGAAKASGNTSRMITWAGTGVGLLNRVQPAGEIVKEVREEAISRIKTLRSYNF